MHDVRETGTFLDDVIKQTCDGVVARKAEVPQAQLVNAANHSEPARPFLHAVRSKELSLVAGLMQASPYHGELNPGMDPIQITYTCQQNGADALAVFTNRLHYMGDVAYMAIVRQAAKLPVLQVDYIVDNYQIYEARANGADAVTLMPMVLPDHRLEEMCALINDLGMTPVMLVHGEIELERALICHSSVFIIENRNPVTFEQDNRITAHLLDMMPAGAAALARSDIDTPDDARKLCGTGIKGLLLGPEIMGADDVGAALRAYRGLC